jgi:nicotinamide mononucleotide (NMN) deamidase PncC/nicotinic acid mononucleotide adenylyltransferase
VQPDLQTELIEAAHSSGKRIVLVATGGGSHAMAALFAVPGASRSMLEAAVPYAPEALSAWIGYKPDDFCSSHTARVMAVAAYERARRYDPQGECCGVACTASLASDRPKRGAHRAHLAYQTENTTSELSIEWTKGARTRAEEEIATSALVLNMIAEMCELDVRVPVPLGSGEEVKRRSIQVSDGLEYFYREPIDAVLVNAVGPDGMKSAARIGEDCQDDPPEAELIEVIPTPKGIFPGAFHPLHRGHRRMHDIAEELLELPVEYELSMVNVDKPQLDFLEIEDRCRQFKADEVLWLGRCPLFTQKAAGNPGAVFVVGVDTIARIADPRYYGGRKRARDRAIAKIKQHECRFLVFGRVVDGVFRSVAELELPKELAEMCQQVPEETFREDISSTDVRRQARDSENG